MVLVMETTQNHQSSSDRSVYHGSGHSGYDDRHSADDSSTQEPVLFDAVLYPHRSLSVRAALVVTAVMGVIFFVVGIFFLALGAWPVLGFFGLDMVLLGGAFWLNFRQARLCERVSLTASRLRIERVDTRGRRCHWDFQPYWTWIEMADTPHHDTPLTLMSRGRRLVIGGFLNGGERFDFARALRHALAKATA